MDKIHFSSDSDSWETPQDLFDELNEEFGFNFDLCANANNTKCLAFTPDVENYVSQIEPIEPMTYWMNPPYSRGSQAKCIKAAYEIAKYDGNIVVCLIPARTDTKIWHQYVWDDQFHQPRLGVELRLLKGRIKFEKDGKPILDKHGRPQSAPFPSAIVIFSGDE